ncbi:MAG: DUF123 domain-containing protein [Halobacteriaceae archaeon]
MQGSYSLVLESTDNFEQTIGSLGTFSFPQGWCVYVGSAFGPGGFSRLDRHKRIATNQSSTLHWHIDYLLHHDAIMIKEAFISPQEDIECEILDSLTGEIIPGFGASDCNCDSHLLISAQYASIETKLREIHTTTYNFE